MAERLAQTAGRAARPGATRLEDLVPVVDVDGPRVRLGVAWAVVTAAALIAGAVATAVLFSVAAAASAAQACRTWRGHKRPPLRDVAVAGAAVLPLAALAGPVGLGFSAGLVAAAAVVLPGLRRLPWGGSGRHSSPTLTTAIALLVGTAAAAPVIVLGELGLVTALVLLAFAHTHDAASYLVGSGATRAWEGPAAAAAAMASVSLAAAAVLAPPFRGAAPWLLGALAAGLAPAGPLAAGLLLGARRARVPALRRLDVFLVLGPSWALAASAMVEVGAP